jgi:hypothetical protein
MNLFGTPKRRKSPKAVLNALNRKLDKKRKKEKKRQEKEQIRKKIEAARAALSR